MRFDNCWNCNGRKTVGGGVFEVPCPRCKDSDGNPAGRVAVLSDLDLQHLVFGCCAVGGVSPCKVCDTHDKSVLDEIRHRDKKS